MCISVYLYMSAAPSRASRAVWDNSGHAAQYYYDMSLARVGMGEGERADASAGSSANINDYVSTLRPVVLRPDLGTSEAIMSKSTHR